MVQGARPAPTKAVAMQVQGNLSASSALLIQEGIAKPDPPTEAHREAPLVPWGISALEELVTGNVALSLLESAQAFTSPAMKAPTRAVSAQMFAPGDIGGKHTEPQKRPGLALYTPLRSLILCSSPLSRVDSCLDGKRAVE